MNIFLRELRANLKSLVIWSIVMILLVVIGLAKFEAFYNDPASLEMVKALPKAMTDVMSLQAFNLTTLNGLYGIMFVYFSLMGGIAAAMWGSDMISKEERDKTVEFSLVLPVSRSRVVTAKALAALVDCIFFVLVTWGMSVAAAQPYKPDASFYNFLTLEMAAMFVIELIFLAIGLLLGCAMILAEVGLAEGIQVLKSAKLGRHGELLYHDIPLTADRLRAVIEDADDAVGTQRPDQVELLGVLGGDLGDILGENPVQFGSGVAVGAHVRDIAPFDDPMGDGTDRDDAGNHQADDLGPILRHLVEVGQGHQQFVTAAGDDEQRRGPQQLGHPLGRGSADLDVVDDPPHITPVAVQREFQQL